MCRHDGRQEGRRDEHTVSGRHTMNRLRPAEGCKSLKIEKSP